MCQIKEQCYHTQLNESYVSFKKQQMYMHVILEMRDRETKNMITYKCSFIKNRSYHFYATSNASFAPTMHYTIVQQGINLGMGFFQNSFNNF